MLGRYACSKNRDPGLSPRLKENREITIGLPASYDKNPDKKYPLLVLLDGDYLFDPFQGALNYGNYWEDLPKSLWASVKTKTTSAKLTAL
jgi:predicted alpha/beta superfamily hydrolase